MSKAEVVDMAVAAVRLIRQLTAEQPATEWVLEYSPETFTATELDFALEVCDAVTAAWGATPENKVILNLPTTVESGDAECLRRPDRVDAPSSRPPRQRHPQRPSAQRPRHGSGGGRARA
jgi:hypothetical protein